MNFGLADGTILRGFDESWGGGGDERAEGAGGGGGAGGALIEAFTGFLETGGDLFWLSIGVTAGALIETCAGLHGIEGVLFWPEFGGGGGGGAGECDVFTGEEFRSRREFNLRIVFWGLKKFFIVPSS